MAGSSRDLWQLISGKAVLWPEEVITSELNRNKDKLLLGLSYFKPLSSATKIDDLKKKISHQLSLNFVVKLAPFLNLDQEQCYDIYCLYLLKCYMGSNKDLEETLSSERHSQMLMDKVRDFYINERIYLLRCIKQILNHYNDSAHPYSDVFKELQVSMVEGNQFINEIKKQFENSYENNTLQQQAFNKSPIVSFSLEKSRQASHLQGNTLRERSELLEVMLLYYKCVIHLPADLFNLLVTFKKHGFGRGMNSKSSLDSKNQFLTNRISFLQSLVIVEGLELEVLIEKYGYGAAANINSEDSVMSDVHFKAFDEVIENLGDGQLQSPLLLAWSVVRHLKARKDFVAIGNKALKSGVFVYIDERIMEMKINKIDPFVESLTHNILYGLINSVLSIFHESSLGETQHLYSITRQYLEVPFVSDAFWSLDQEEGVRSLLTSSLEYFPTQFFRPMEILTCLVRSGFPSLQQVVRLVQNLPSLADRLGRSARIVPTEEDNIYRLPVAAKPTSYPHCKFYIPSNTLGRMLTDAIIDGQQTKDDLIVWYFQYDGFDLLLSEVAKLLQFFDERAGSVDPNLVFRVSTVMSFVGECLKVNSDFMRDELVQFGGFVDGSLQLLQRFSTSSNPCVELISSCLLVLCNAMNIFPSEIWRGLQMMGFVPNFLHRVNDISQAVKALNSGTYGRLLMSCEAVMGRYSVTEAFLEFLHLVVDHTDMKEVMLELTPSVLFVCQEIFPTHDKWKYSNEDSRRRIGLLCMKIFKKILDVNEETDRDDGQNESSHVTSPRSSDLKFSKLSVQSVVISALLYSEAGNALLDIINIGVEEIGVRLANQNSAFEGDGTNSVELVKLSLSILNGLLVKRPDLASASPYLARALSSIPSNSYSFYGCKGVDDMGLAGLKGKVEPPSHLVKSVVLYVYHRHDCSLVVEATQLLKHLALIFPLSMLACMGSDVHPIKDVYLERLQTITEDVNLKVAILEWLTACVQNQPGLVEIFTNDAKSKLRNPDNEPIALFLSEPNIAPHEGELGAKSICLQAIVKLIRKDKQGTYQCPPELLCASLEFLHSLWKEFQLSAMLSLKNVDNFWDCLFHVLEKEKLDNNKIIDEGNVSATRVKCVSHVLRIFALEVFHRDRHEKACPVFATKLASVLSSDTILSWSKFVQFCLTTNYDGVKSNIDVLLMAWRVFLTVFAAKKNHEWVIQGKEEIIFDLLDVLFNLVSPSSSSPMSSPSPSQNVKMSAVVSSLVLILVNRWCNAIVNQKKFLELSCNCLERMLSGSFNNKFNDILLSLVGSLVTTFKQCKRQFFIDPHNSDLVKRLLDIICMLLQSSLLYGEELGVDCQSPSKRQKLSQFAKLKYLPVSIICLLTEVLSVTSPRKPDDQKQGISSPLPTVSFPSGSPSRTVTPPPLSIVFTNPSALSSSPVAFVFAAFNRYSVVQCLISWCTHCLSNQTNLDLVQSIFRLFLELAKNQKGAEMLLANGMSDQLGIYIHRLYSHENMRPATNEGEIVATPSSSTSPFTTSHERHLSTYLLYSQLIIQMLSSLGPHFIDKAFDFIGLHKGRFQSVLQDFGAFFSGRPAGNDEGGNGASGKFKENDKMLGNLALYELEMTCRFVNEVAKYNKEWKVAMPDVLQTVMTSLCIWTQKTAGLLLLPRLMQSIIESQRSGQTPNFSSVNWNHCRHFLTTAEDSNTPELLKLQQKILSVLACNLVTMRRFSIPLYDIIFQNLEDLPTYDPFVLIDFSNPSIDENSPPTFGMLVSIFNFCIELLNKSDGSRSHSPLKTPTQRLIQTNNLNKPLVLFVIDQVVYLMMSHAARYLKDPMVHAHEKQLLRRDLNNELSSCLVAVHRHLRTSSPSPLTPRRSSMGVPVALVFSGEHQLLSLADTFTKQILKC